eukprot:1133717-Prymnesium_polylepis.1
MAHERHGFMSATTERSPDDSLCASGASSPPRPLVRPRATSSIGRPANSLASSTRASPSRERACSPAATQ